MSRDAHLAVTVSTKFEVDTTIRCLVRPIALLLLMAEIGSLVWGIPANFHGFHVLTALLEPNFAVLNRGRHLYSAGRPSCSWALAHILVKLCFINCYGRTMELVTANFQCCWPA